MSNLRPQHRFVYNLFILHSVLFIIVLTNPAECSRHQFFKTPVVVFLPPIATNHVKFMLVCSEFARKKKAKPDNIIT